MAVAFVRSHGPEFEKTVVGTTDAYGLTATVPAGNVLVAYCVHDNGGGGTGSGVVTSISVPAGETASWVLIGRATTSATGTAGLFANGEIWAIKTTVSWATGTSLTFTYDFGPLMNAQTILEFSGADAVARSTAGSAYSTTTAQASASTTGTAPVVGDLVVGLLFHSNNASPPPDDTDTVGGNWITNGAFVGSTGGSAATNNAGSAYNKITTSTSHQTLNAANVANAGNGVVVGVLRQATSGVSAAASVAVTTSRTATVTKSTSATASLAVTTSRTAAATVPGLVTATAGLAVTTSRTAVASVSGGAFVPSDLTGLASWYDAADASSFTYSSGTSVSQWNDKSGLGRHLAQASSSLQPSRSGVQNGRATVLHDGIDDYMDTASFTLAQPMTVFIAQDNGGQASQGWLSSVGNNFQIYTGGSNLFIYCGTTPSGLSLTNAISGPHTWSFYANGASTQGYKDGTLLATGDTGSNGTTTGWRTAERNLTSGYRLQGELFEIVVYDRILTTTERQQVEAYLDYKWISGPPPSGGTTYTATAALSVTTSITATAVPDKKAPTNALAVTTSRTAAATRAAAPATASLALTATLSASATRSAAPATGSLTVTATATAVATSDKRTGTTALAVTTTRTAAATRSAAPAAGTLLVTTTATAAATRATSTGTSALAVTTTLSAAATKSSAGSVGGTLAVTTTASATATRSTFATASLAVTTTRTAAATADKRTGTTGLAVTTSRTAAAGRTTFSTTTPLAVTTTASASATKSTPGTVGGNLAVTTTVTASTTRSTSVTTSSLAVTTSRTATVAKGTSTTTTSLSVTTTRTAVAGVSKATTTVGLAVVTSRTASATRTTRVTGSLAVTATFTATAGVSIGTLKIGWVVVDGVKRPVVGAWVMIGGAKREVVRARMVVDEEIRLIQG